MSNPVSPSPNSLPLIAFAGAAGSGKDTAAFAAYGMFQTEYRYAFANPIRAMLKAGFDIDMYQPYWIERKNEVIPWLGRSPRQLMQTLGTEWGREQVHTNLWVVLAEQHYQTAVDQRADAFILTDYRFPNEGDWLREKGACIIHIDRPSLVRIADSGHASELGLERGPTDYTVVNDGTVEDLRAKVELVIVDFERSRNKG